MEVVPIYGKEVDFMLQQQCLLCGQEHSTGLNVMGCLLCFSCEKELLRTTAASISRQRRANLLRLYGAQPKGRGVTPAPHQGYALNPSLKCR